MRDSVERNSRNTLSTSIRSTDKGKPYVWIKRRYKLFLTVFTGLIIAFLLGTIAVLPLFDDRRPYGQIITDSEQPNAIIIGDESFNNTDNLGWELLDDGKIIHAWNKYDSYYFNNSNGVQFSNHYEEYWTTNVLMLGYYAGDIWNLLYRTDELSGFTRDFNGVTNNFMNLTLWKDISYSGYDFRLAIRYHLKTSDFNLTVIPYIKNIGKDIPFDIGFGWELKDIQIDNDVENDRFRLDSRDVFSLHNDSLNKVYTDITTPVDIGNNTIINVSNPVFRLDDLDSNGLPEKTLYLRWKPNLDYRVTVKSRVGQYNAPVTLFIKVGTLSSGQEKKTELHWYDADISYGSHTQFYTYFSGNRCVSIAKLDTNKFVMSYGYKELKIRVGNVSGTTITLGTEVEVDSDVDVGGDTPHDLAPLDTDKFVVCYTDDSDDAGWAVAATVSDTTITLGTKSKFEAGNAKFITCTQLDTNKFVVSYNDETDSDCGKSIVGNISSDDTTITWGDSTNWSEITDYFPNVHIDSCKLDTDKFVCAFFSSDLDNDGYIFVGTASGNTLTIGTVTEFLDKNINVVGLCSPDTDKFVLIYDSSEANQNMSALVGTVSGTTITFGSATDLNISNPRNTRLTAIDSTHFVLIISDASDNNYGKSIYGSVDFTSRTVDTNSPETFSAKDASASKFDMDLVLIDTDKIAVGYFNDTDNTVMGVIGETPEVPNNIPTQSGEAPVNGSTGGDVESDLYVICSDSDSDIMTATWMSNSSGSWVQFGETNTSISTGTNITQNNSNFSSYSTKYWWSVNLTDGEDWCNATYHYTTRAGDKPTVEEYIPVNGSTDVLINPICKAWINHTGAKSMTVNWYENSTASGGSKNWYDANFTYRKLITINSSKIGDTLKNFPVLIYASSDSDLSSNAQGDGDDIFFVDYDDNTTKYNHEIENYTSGTLWAWVNITSLSDSVDTNIWMYYGNATCASQEDITNTWNSDYILIQHFDETYSTGANNYKDSTSNNQDGTLIDSDTDSSSGKGIVYNTINFNGDADYVSIPNNAILETNEITVELWSNTTVPNSDYDTFISLGGHGAEDWLLQREGASDKLRVSWDNSFFDSNTANVFEDGEWHYASFSRDDDTNNIMMYYDGYYETSSTTPGDINFDAVANNLEIARRTDTTSQYITGGIDEIRLSSIVRNTSWISCTYNTTNDPEGFHFYDSQETYSAGTPSWTLRQTNNSVNDGDIVWWDSDGIFNSKDTDYYWKVTADDGTHNISSWFKFTTEPSIISDAVEVKNPYPSDSATNVLTGIGNLSAYIANATYWNITLYDYNSNNVSYNSGGIGDGIKYCDVETALYFKLNRSFSWHVNATNGTSWDNHSYSFDTFNGSGYILKHKLDVPYSAKDIEYHTINNVGYIFVAAGAGGLNVYLWENETLTLLDTFDDDNDFSTVTANDTYIFAGCDDSGGQDGGIYAFTFDENGTRDLWNKSWDEDTTYNRFIDLDCDENYIFGACEDGGINAMTYTDGGGFSELAQESIPGDGDSTSRIVWNGTYVYCIDYTHDKLYAYAFDGGSFAHIDDVQDDASGYYSLTIDDDYIYATGEGGDIYVYTFDGTSFTKIYQISPDEGKGNFKGLFFQDDYLHITEGGSEEINMSAYNYIGGDLLNRDNFVGIPSLTETFSDRQDSDGVYLFVGSTDQLRIFGFELYEVAPPDIDMIYAGNPGKDSGSIDDVVRYLNCSYNNESFCNVTANISVPIERRIGRYFKTTDDSLLISSGNLSDSDETVWVDESNHSFIASKYLCTYTGDYNNITAYIVGSGHYQPWVAYAIYTDNSDEPGTLLGFTERDRPGSSYPGIYYPPCTHLWYTLGIGYDGNGNDANHITLNEGDYYWLVMATNDSDIYGWNPDTYWILGNVLGGLNNVKTAPYNINSDMNFSNATGLNWETNSTAKNLCIYASADDTYNDIDELGIYSVTLEWYDGSSWADHTMSQIGDTDKWTINMTSLTSNNWYTFNITAIDEVGSTVTYEHYRWLSHGETEMIQFQCNVPNDYDTNNVSTDLYNSSYTFYIYNATYATDKWYGDDEHMENVLRHEQGVDGTIHDTGYWLNDIPSDEYNERHCLKFAGGWWDENITIEKNLDLDNAYLHWWTGGGSDWNASRIHYGRSNSMYDFEWNNLSGQDWGYTELDKLNSTTRYNLSITPYRSSNYADGYYKLLCKKINLSDKLSDNNFDGNSIYNFFMGFDYNGSFDWNTNAILVSNRSVMSFLIFNLPDNDTLQNLDNDNDGLTDYDELFTTFTHPFINDTDNDKYSDYDEWHNSSSPNNYTELPRVWQQFQDWNITLCNQTVSWKEIQDWNITLCNQTVNWQNIQDWNITLSNITDWSEIQDWNITLCNQTIDWYQIQDWNLTLSNVSSWLEIQDWNITLSNTTDWSEIQDWNITLSNTTDWQNIQDWNITLSNSTAKIWETINNWNITLSNSSITWINITNIYPIDNSHNIPLQPITYATFESRTGSSMNATWYYGTNETTQNLEIGNQTNFYNSTQNTHFIQLTQRGTRYWIRIQADDGTHYKNSTVQFRSEGYPGASVYMPTSNIYGIIGLFGIIGLIALIVIILKKKKTKQEENQFYNTYYKR